MDKNKLDHCHSCVSIDTFEGTLIDPQDAATRMGLSWLSDNEVEGTVLIQALNPIPHIYIGPVEAKEDSKTLFTNDLLLHGP